MRENKMISRVLHEDGCVYYRFKDLRKLFNCSDYKIKKAIKVFEIETHKLDFGRTLFVKEEDISKININNSKMSMRTAYKDLHKEIKSYYGMNKMLNVMFPAIKKSEQELQSKTIEEANNSLDSVDKNYSRYENNEYMQVFNKVAKELGFCERIHKVKMLCNNEDEISEYMLIDRKGDIIADAGYFMTTLECFEAQVREGKFELNEDDYLFLTKGNPYKVKNENELLDKLHNLAVNCKYEKESVDSSTMTLPNEAYYNVSIDFLHAIYFDKLVILKDDLEEELLNELNNNEVTENYTFLDLKDEIIDVDYVEVLEQDTDSKDDNITDEEMEMLCNKALPSIFRTGAYINDDLLQKTIENPQFLIDKVNEMKADKEKKRLADNGIDIDNVVDIDYVEENKDVDEELELLFG
ncbi:hypothetical protein QOZ83_15670 [Romboutsia sedimentorum]|uniref:hypothetical protein n=1 Tax=Romboutsia sedimentorum TaxID=1368474 RepID=UPI0024DEBF3F|nr:hypothetical protein [Romboutsia sedimentorum]MDK2587285.1 hypothetical protein [Romboutsia sedimentorum]